MPPPKNTRTPRVDLEDGDPGEEWNTDALAAVVLALLAMIGILFWVSLEIGPEADQRVCLADGGTYLCTTGWTVQDATAVRVEGCRCEGRGRP